MVFPDCLMTAKRLITIATRTHQRDGCRVSCRPSPEVTMNRIVRVSAVAASVGLAVMVLSFTSAGPALAQTFKPVMSLIVNDAAHPVPVIDVGPSAPAAEPFQHQVSSFVPASLSLLVPANKRLVIEFYSGSAATLAPCTMAGMAITTKVSGDGLRHRLLAVPVPEDQPNDFHLYSVSQLVRLNAAPGTLVQFAATTNPGCPADFLGVVSGYLIAAS
jgi:hypothetical protein